jgi:hypothetical protein
MTPAERVAHRFILARDVEAGIFEAPPAMLVSVGRWIRSVYAGHVLAAVEKHLQAVGGADKVLDARIREMQAAVASCQRDVRALKPGQSVRYPIWGYRASLGAGAQSFVGVRRHKDMYRSPEGAQTVYMGKPEAGATPLYELGWGVRNLSFGDFPGSRHADEAEAVDRIEGVLEVAIERQQGHLPGSVVVTPSGMKKVLPEYQPMDREVVVFLLLLKREVMKYTDGPKTYTAKARKKFPIDLTGWRYLQANSPIIKRVNENIDEKNRVVVQQLEVAKETYALATKAWGLAKGNPDWPDDKRVTEILDKLDTDWFKDPYSTPYWNRWRVQNAIANEERPDRPMGQVNRKAVPITELKIEPPLGPTDFQRALEHEGWAEIQVELDFKGHKESVGMWLGADRLLSVDIRGNMPASVKEFQGILANILQTTRHELQHVGQDVLARLKGLREDAGLPSPSLRVPSTKEQKGRKPHPLREEEFYTRLADEVEEFVSAVQGKAPAELYMGSLKAVFKRWVGGREFFVELAKHERLKWEKAVKLFQTGIEAQGVDLSG